MQDLIKLAVKKNFEARDKYEHMQQTMSKVAYSREFKTVHIDIGRATGKTTAINDLVRPTDLVIVPNMGMQSHYESWCVSALTLDTILLNERRFMGCSYDYVWIDEPAMCNRVTRLTCSDAISCIYDIIDANIFIKIGA